MRKQPQSRSGQPPGAAGVLRVVLILLVLILLIAPLVSGGIWLLLFLILLRMILARKGPAARSTLFGSARLAQNNELRRGGYLASRIL